jgi:hypothetical protein
MPTKSACILLTTITFFAACDSTRVDEFKRLTEAGDGGPVSSACEDGWKRCLGQTIQQCQAGQWSDVKTCGCTGEGCDEICAAGSCEKTGPMPASCNLRAVYEGDYHLTTRYQPVPVTSCIPGGVYPKELSYREDQSETRARSLSFDYRTNSVCAADPFALGIDWNGVFGIDTRSTTSSATSTGDLRVQLPPGQFGMFYRQTSEVLRVARIYNGDIYLGVALLNDWTFTPAFGLAESCPPPSSLPTAGNVPCNFNDGCVRGPAIR